MRGGFLRRINWGFNLILIQAGATHDIINQPLRNTILVLQGYAGRTVLGGGYKHSAMSRMSRGANYDVCARFLFANSGFQISQVCRTQNAGGFLVPPEAELTISNINICIFFHKGSHFEKPGFGILNEPVSGLKMVNNVNGPLHNLV